MTTTAFAAKDIAKAAGISPATKRYILRDDYGMAYDGGRFDHVLAALMRSDKTADLPMPVRIAAMALHKSISSARMNAISAMRISAYSPYKLCQLVAHIAAENPTGTIGSVCDGWLVDNHTTI